MYTVDFEKREVVQHVDWNASVIDFEGRGADRGLRGIEFNGDDIYSDRIRYAGRDGSNIAFKIQTYDPNEIEFAGVDDSRVARRASVAGCVGLANPSWPAVLRRQPSVSTTGTAIRKSGP